MGIVDGNASHLHFQARLCRIWNCYDMFDKLKSIWAGVTFTTRNLNFCCTWKCYDMLDKLKSRASQLQYLLLPSNFQNSKLKTLRKWQTLFLPRGFLKQKTFPTDWPAKHIKTSGNKELKKLGPVETKN